MIRKISSCDDKPSISTYGLSQRPTRLVPGDANKCRWRPRRYQVDPTFRSSPGALVSYMVRYYIAIDLFCFFVVYTTGAGSSSSTRGHERIYICKRGGRCYGQVKGGESLPAAPYALLPNLKKSLFFAIERDREIMSSVFCTPVAKCLFIKRLASARHMSPAIV